MAIEIVDLPIKFMVDLSIVMLVYRRVNLHFSMVFLWFSHGFPGRVNTKESLGTLDMAIQTDQRKALLRHLVAQLDA